MLDDLTGRFVLRDNDNVQVTTERMLRPAFCLRDGQRHDANSRLLPRELPAAA